MTWPWLIAYSVFVTNAVIFVEYGNFPIASLAVATIWLLGFIWHWVQDLFWVKADSVYMQTYFVSYLLQMGVNTSDMRPEILQAVLSILYAPGIFVRRDSEAHLRFNASAKEVATVVAKLARKEPLTEAEAKISRGMADQMRANQANFRNR